MPLNVDFTTRLPHISDMKFFIHIAMMFAILTAGVSPACAFMSGDMDTNRTVTIDGAMYIEICRGLDVVRIAIDDNGNEIIGSQHQVPHDQALADMCGFCLAQTTMKADLIPEPQILAPDMAIVAAGAFVSEHAAYKASSSLANASRAPPYSS
jgi:hypothetical protein